MGDGGWELGHGSRTGQAALICAWFSFKVCENKIPDAIFDFIVSKRIGKQSARKKNKQTPTQPTAGSNKCAQRFWFARKNKNNKKSNAWRSIKRGKSAGHSEMRVCVSGWVY